MAYADLSYVKTTGGNPNFIWLGDPSDLSFIPRYGDDSCPGMLCRVGGVPSIHWHDSADDGSAILHLDHGNPLWGFGLGAFVHGFIDVLLGNINPSVPIM